MADPEAIKRAVANLVDNAAEAMQDSAERNHNLNLAGGQPRRGRICVSDTGQGVSHDVKERLFLPYFSTKQRGTGLGLAIVSRIIEDHRGSIRIEENKPVGTRFVIELPVAARTPPTPLTQPKCITFSSSMTNRHPRIVARHARRRRLPNLSAPTAAKTAWSCCVKELSM